MAPSAISQRRTHNLLLFQKLLNLREGASPFTLLLDTLEQSAQPVVREFMERAKVRSLSFHIAIKIAKRHFRGVSVCSGLWLRALAVFFILHGNGGTKLTITGVKNKNHLRIVSDLTEAKACRCLHHWPQEGTCSVAAGDIVPSSCNQAVLSRRTKSKYVNNFYKN